jgi:hypothetical protein
MKKSGLNKFAGYSYFELGDFIPHIQTIFNEVGLCGVVSFDTAQATLCITDTEDGSQIVVTSPMAEANLKGAHPIQNLGAVLSYQRRYLCMAAMDIVENDIIDSGPAAEPKPEPKHETKEAKTVLTLPAVPLAPSQVKPVKTILKKKNQMKKENSENLFHAAKVTNWAKDQKQLL